MEIRTYTAEQEAELLNREESHFLDFKRASIMPGKLQETVVALANADGGEVVIGLDDDIRRAPSRTVFMVSEILSKPIIM